jgi:hypothetical protein
MAMGPQFGNMTATTPAEVHKLFVDMFHLFGKVWPYFAVLQLLSLVLQAGLTVGASANAYKLITGGDDVAPPPAKVLA